MPLSSIPEDEYVEAITQFWITKKELDSFPKGLELLKSRTSSEEFHKTMRMASIY
jgi:hypothetical protein